MGALGGSCSQIILASRSRHELAAGRQVGYVLVVLANLKGCVDRTKEVLSQPISLAIVVGAQTQIKANN